MIGFQTAVEIIVLISIWIGGHLCLCAAVHEKYKQVGLLAVLFCMVVIYSLKPATFDLFGYSIYFDTGYWPYETYSVGPDGLNVEDIYSGDEDGVPYFDKFSNEIKEISKKPDIHFEILILLFSVCSRLFSVFSLSGNLS